MIEAAIFDMDGLLIDSEPFWVESEKKVFATVGFELTDEMCLQTFGMRIQEVIPYWYNYQPWDKSQKSYAQMPVLEPATLAEDVEASLWTEKLLTNLSVLFAILALTIAAAGLYALLSYLVILRKRG